jgi:hypothetical protein
MKMPRIDSFVIPSDLSLIIIPQINWVQYIRGLVFSLVFQYINKGLPIHRLIFGFLSSLWSKYKQGEIL